MKDFIGVKHVKAKPMTRGEYDSLWAIPLGSPITPKTAQTPQDPNLEGYLVEYQDGGKPNHKDFDNYISWSPKEVFEKAYFHTPLYPDHAMQIMRTAVNAQGDISTPPLTFDFSAALSQLKTGACVSRHAWRQGERNKWLSVSNPESIELPAERFWSPHNRAHAEANGGSAKVLPSITIKTYEGDIQMGWVPEQMDLFAKDWYICKPNAVTEDDLCKLFEMLRLQHGILFKYYPDDKELWYHIDVESSYKQLTSEIHIREFLRTSTTGKPVICKGKAWSSIDPIHGETLTLENVYKLVSSLEKYLETPANNISPADQRFEQDTKIMPIY
jgi:hypothetical protein